MQYTVCSKCCGILERAGRRWTHYFTGLFTCRSGGDAKPLIEHIGDADADYERGYADGYDEGREAEREEVEDGYDEGFRSARLQLIAISADEPDDVREKLREIARHLRP